MKYTAAPSVIYVDDWFKSAAYWFCFVLPGWVFFYLSLCVSFKLFLSWILAVCHVHLFIDLVVEFWYCCALFYTFLRAEKKKKKKSNEKKKIMMKKKKNIWKILFQSLLNLRTLFVSAKYKLYCTVHKVPTTLFNFMCTCSWFNLFWVFVCFWFCSS